MFYYYFISAVLTAISFILFLIFTNGKKVDLYMLLLELLMLVTNAGYVAAAVAVSLEEAILANKIVYIGGCFIPPVIIAIISSVCNYKIPKILNTLMGFFSAAVYVLVLSTGYSEIYYKSSELSSLDGVAILKRTYGPLHFMFNVLLYGYAAISLGIVIYALIKKKKKNVSAKNTYIMLVMGLGMLAIFIAMRVINRYVSGMPAAFAFTGFMILYLNDSLSLYEVESCIINSLNNQTTYGYVITDKQKNYLGCNKAANRILPGLEECTVDYRINTKPIVEALPFLLDDRTAVDTWDFEKDGRYYECRVENTLHRNRHIGYIIEMRDNTEKHNYVNLLSNYANELESQVKDKTSHIQSIQDRVILAMADMVENRDTNTGGHVKRTSVVVRILINTIKDNHILECSEEFYSDVIKAAPMHDLGKIAIDDAILRKPGRLTNEEFEAIKRHSEKSAQLVEEILRGVEDEHFVNIAVNIARHHHEKWNGSGYPDKLAGEEIPLEARIMAIADVYDALVTRRCYKEPMTFKQADKVMLESMGTHFDPSLSKAFELSRPRLEKYYKKVNEAEFPQSEARN